MRNFREGTPTKDDVDIINKMCLINSTHDVPEGTQIATFFNRDRDAINCAIFERIVENSTVFNGDINYSAIVVFMDNLEMKDTKNVYARINSNAMKKWFYSNCGENCCKMDEHQTGRVDPVLKLYANCPLMLTQNKDVRSGQANGSRVFLLSVNRKAGETPFILQFENGKKFAGFLQVN